MKKDNFKEKNFGAFVKNHVYRVLVFTSKNSKPISSGTGFFISKTTFLTCFHVIFCSELKEILQDETYKNSEGSTQHAKLFNFYKKKNLIIKIELHNGLKIESSIKKFDEIYDTVILEIFPEDHKRKFNVCKLDHRSRLFYGQAISFGGFSSQFNYPHDETPFAYNEGIISSFPITTVAGGEYEHLKMNIINLSGNSGAPVFLKGSKKVIGMVNGNMNWGRDDLLAINKKIIGGPPIQVSNRIPLSIAYATTIKTLKNKEII